MRNLSLLVGISFLLFLVHVLSLAHTHSLSHLSLSLTLLLMPHFGCCCGVISSSIRSEQKLKSYFGLGVFISSEVLLNVYEKPCEKLLSGGRIACMSECKEVELSSDKERSDHDILASNTSS